MDKGNWTYRKLGEVAESELGKTLDSKKNTGNLNPYLCAVNVQWDRFELDALKEMKFEECEKERYSIREGDLVVCEGGDIGRCAIWNKKETVLYQNALHRVRFNGEMLPRFCMFFLMNLKKSGELDAKYGKGVTIKHLVKSSLLSIPVPVPPLPIQQRIVAELDCISTILEKKRQQLKELDNLAQAIFYDMFGDPVENEKGWEVNSLNRIALLKNGLNFGRVDEGIKVKILGVSDFQENKKISSKEIGYTIVSKEVEDNFYLKDNDLVFVRSNGSKSLIGRCVLINTFGEKVSFSGFCIRCRIISDKVIPQFLLSLMQEPKVKVQLTCGGRGCNIQNINQENLGKQPVILPPLSLQQSFAAKIEAIEKQKERISQSIKEVQTLFDSRMEEYFG